MGRTSGMNRVFLGFGEAERGEAYPSTHTTHNPPTHNPQPGVASCDGALIPASLCFTIRPFCLPLLFL